MMKLYGLVLDGTCSLSETDADGWLSAEKKAASKVVPGGFYDMNGDVWKSRTDPPFMATSYGTWMNMMTNQWLEWDTLFSNPHESDPCS